MMRRYLVLVGLFMLFIGARTFALELTSGKIRIDISQSSGRFIAYYHASAKDWTPLFSAVDPRTTVLEVLAGQEFYRMGDSSRFKQSVTKTQGGGEISWKWKNLSVSESFAFKRSIGAAESDGFLITIHIANQSQTALPVGVRYLIDTSLGEASRIEFMTPTASSMSNETQYQGSDIPAYWISPQDSRMTVALEAVLRAPGITLPSRIIFANWKRLNESGWDYTVDPSRNFNMLPYSINDSAVAMYYDPELLQPGAERTITMLLGQYNSAGWSETPASTSQAAAPAQPSPSVSQLLDQVTAPAASQPSAPAAGQPASPRAAVLADLKTVDGVLQEIKKMLDTPSTASQSDIDVLRQVLDKLNSHKNQIEQQ